MPIDPSIIGNVMAPQAVQMPDVNAMMQNRTAGMENIYQIETARQAQAAEQAKAQEAEAIKALSPAIAAAFEDPSDAGLDAAFSLVPEEFGSAADEQLTQLRAIPDINRRKAVIRSALLQDDYGRALLAQLEPTANMRLQEATAGRRAALDERRLALEEARLNQPETMTPYQQAQIDLEKAKLEETKTKETAEEVKKRLSEEKRDKDIAFAIKEVEAAAAKDGLLDDATSSYFGNAVDAALQTFGIGTPGAIANAKMKPIADLVLKLVPRFEGPQSDKDTQSYKDAAGDLANPNVPASVKKAAATQIVGLLKKYSGQFEYTGGEDTGGGGISEGTTATNPQTGERIIYRDGQWQPL